MTTVETATTLKTRVIALSGPDREVDASDKIQQLADQFLTLPNSEDDTGYDPDSATELMVKNGLDCKVVRATSGGNSDGWQVDIRVVEDGNWDELCRRLLEMADGAVCGVREGVSFTTPKGQKIWGSVPLLKPTVESISIQGFSQATGIPTEVCEAIGLEVQANELSRVHDESKRSLLQSVLHKGAQEEAWRMGQEVTRSGQDACDAQADVREAIAQYDLTPRCVELLQSVANGLSELQELTRLSKSGFNSDEVW